MNQVAATTRSVFLEACFRQQPERTPVWIMRQAGRYLPAYRKLRERVSFLELCKSPDLAAEVSYLPVEVLGVDAAIVFSDILIPFEPMGLAVQFGEGGPQIENPPQKLSEVKKLTPFDPVLETGFVGEAIRQLKKALSPDIPVIGFAGAPFTLCLYALGGKGSKDFDTARQILHTAPEVFLVLAEKFTEAVSDYLTMQIEAGAAAVQLFDTWAGLLSPGDYRRFAFPFVRQIVERLSSHGTPTILYQQDGGAHMEAAVETGINVLSVDWRVDLGKLFDRCENRVAFQGNLDPYALLGEPEAAVEKAKEILEQVGGRPGHIFNLGHGILPSTPVKTARSVVEFVKNFQPAGKTL
ncbi:MAG: uroporphyrinogen decarboxylase [Candidatus Zixiibacteriota bacterium]